jgi:hypothetical protein
MYASKPYISVSPFKRSLSLTLEYRNAQAKYEPPATLVWITYSSCAPIPKQEGLIRAAGLFSKQVGLLRAAGLFCTQVV